MSPRHPHRQHRRLADARGFTLVELLVATVAGLFVVLAAFLRSKGSTRLFADENRIGAAQLNLRLGLDRLRSDLTRAGYMSSPNVKLDPDVCPDPNSSGVVARLQSVFFQPGGSYAATTPGSSANSLYPDAITVSGNFAGADSYLVSSVEPSPAGGFDIWLQRNFGAMQRLLSQGETGTTQNVLDATFPQGKMLRLQNPLGSSQFVVIDTVALGAVTGGLAPKIHLATSPAVKLVDPANPDKRCGITGYGLGSTVNAVQFIKYDLRNLAALAPWAYPDGDPLKYDLVRTEVNPDGTEGAPAGTGGPATPPPQSIVAEYVVDLKFAFTIDEGTLLTGGFREPRMVAYPYNDPTATAAASDILAAGGARPQRIRSIRFQVTTRSKDPDRSVAIGDAGSGLLRYLLPGGPVAQYARARTDVGEVMLVNQKGLTW